MRDVYRLAVLFILSLLLFGASLILTAPFSHADPVTTAIGDGAKAVCRAADIDWGGKTLKWSFVLTAVGTNMLRMWKEADTFDDRDLLPGGTYHAVDAGFILGIIALGWMGAEIWDHDQWSTGQKLCLYAGTGLLCWEAGDGWYKDRRGWGWMNSDPAHNRNNIPWYDLSLKPFRVRDDFRGTDETTTPLLHGVRIGSGSYLIGRVH